MKDALSDFGSGLIGGPGQLSAVRATLVTGAGGFIGRHVVSQLRATGVKVVSIEHAWHSREQVDTFLGASSIDRCIHLGWYAKPADYLSSELENLRSLRSAIDLLSALISRGCEHLTVAGTSAEYRPGPLPLTERDEVAQATPYAGSKSALRDLTAELSRLGLLSTGWCRIFNVTGPGEHPDRFVPLVTQALLDGSPIDLTDGEQIRDFLDVRDVAAALIAVSRRRLTGPVNVCSGDGVRLRDLVLDLASRCGSFELLHFGALTRSSGEPDIVVGDNARLVNESGWHPSRSRSQMLDGVVQYWRSQLEQG